MRTFAITFAAALASGAAFAQQEPRKITAIDLGLDYKPLAGQRVRLTDCIMSAARIDFASCPIVTNSGIGGMIKVEYAASDKRGRRRALDECSDFQPKRRCVAEVVGRVRGSLVGNLVVLQDATIEWKQP